MLNPPDLDSHFKSLAPVVKRGTRWHLTAANLSEEFWERAERLTRLRREEHRQVQEYVRLDWGRMEFLIAVLDGDSGTSLSAPAPIW